MGRFARVERNWRQYFGVNAIGATCKEDVALLICGLTGLSKGTLADLDVFDRLMLEQFERTDARARGRVIKTLEQYAATLGRAGEQRETKNEPAPEADRNSGNSRV